LRAWVRRLRANGVEFRTGARLTALTRDSDRWRGDFQTAGDNISIDADAIVLALGGASWPETGSDGAWPAILARYGIEIAPWLPANCGWTVDWPNELLVRAEGLPLKNLTVRAGGESVSGELLLTAHGLEGGAIYRLGRTLRSMSEPRIVIDFKPQLSFEALRERGSSASDPRDLFRRWKLSAAAIALMETFSTAQDNELDRLIEHVKNFALPLLGPRPVAEAISSAGGIRWSELDQNLMLRKLLGIFVAGEMIDWEAPTGGYLLQGCFATATRAGREAADFSSLPKSEFA
jgi:uncharacterized flavoprotein (TIGR03862 family)